MSTITTEKNVDALPRCPRWLTQTEAVPRIESRRGHTHIFQPFSHRLSTPMRNTPPYRADHVGSLLRPAELLRAREDHAAGRISAEQRRLVEDGAIREAVRLQEDVGLQSVTDGEFRRGSWHMDFLYQIGGVTVGEELQQARFRNEQGEIVFTPVALRVSRALSLDKP